MESNRSQEPSLDAVAQHVGLSRLDLQHLFVLWADIDPGEFLKCLNLTHARTLLGSGKSALQAAVDTELAGPRRRHVPCVSIDAAMPEEIKSDGRGWTLSAGFAETPFGHCLVAQNTRGIYHLSFTQTLERQTATDAILFDWPSAGITWDEAPAQHIANTLFCHGSEEKAQTNLNAVVKGTNFQLKVWRALLQIAPGCLVSYADIAEAVGQPSATRAVGTAVGKNCFAYVIPCHRVIRQTGAIGGYRWGSYRKKAMIAWETCGTDIRLGAKVLSSVEHP